MLAIHDSPLAQKHAAFARLSDADLSVISGLYHRRRWFGHDPAGPSRSRHLCVRLGLGLFSYRVLPDGNRQIVSIKNPCDFLGLRLVLFRTSDHNVEPLPLVHASEISSREPLAAFSQTPRLATAGLWHEAMVVEHLVGLGRRTALERMAHFLLELGARLRLGRDGRPDGLSLPSCTISSGRCLRPQRGSLIRVLRELRVGGMLTFQKGRVVFIYYDATVELEGYDREYLDHDGPLLK